MIFEGLDCGLVLFLRLERNKRMNDMETFNAITPLLNPGITDEEAKEVVVGLTDSQKDIAILALTRAFRETMARIKRIGLAGCSLSCFNGPCRGSVGRSGKMRLWGCTWRIEVFRQMYQRNDSRTGYNTVGNRQLYCHFKFRSGKDTRGKRVC